MNSDQPFEFDELTYLELNPDVEAAVLAGAFTSAEDHWAKHGNAEGRLTTRPARPANAPQGWDEFRYLQANPDVWGAVRAGAFPSGYDHWVLYGNDEDRPGSPLPHCNSAPEAVFAKVPFGFNCFGYSSAPSGLGSGVRGHLDAFRSLTPNVLDTQVPVWGSEPAPAREFDPGRNPFAVNVVHQNPDVLPLFLSHYRRDTFVNRINIGCWVWELHAAYPNWSRFSRLFHEIWVPSEFVRKSMSTISEVPLAVLPYVVDRLPDSPVVTRQDMGIPQQAFTFLYIFDIASGIGRKNPLALLHAFRLAFGDRSDVALVLKYQNGSVDPTAAATIERLAAGFGNVSIFDQTLPASHVYSLLQLSDCFVSPHRSEGFGLNIASAMYYAKPVIATGYSGNMDFTTKETAFLIDHTVVPVGSGQPHYHEGYGWAEPSVDHLRVLLLRVFDNRELAAGIGSSGQKLIRQKYSLEVISHQTKTRLADLGYTGEGPPDKLR